MTNTIILKLYIIIVFRFLSFDTKFLNLWKLQHKQYYQQGAQNHNKSQYVLGT